MDLLLVDKDMNEEPRVIWTLSSNTWTSEGWQQGRVQFRAKSAEKSYEYAVCKSLNLGH